MDGGEVWEAKVNSPENKVDLAGVDVLTVAINPASATTVFFGTLKNGILKTTDGGETIATTNFISEKVYGLEFDPKEGRTVYASGVWEGRGKIFKSLNLGDTWDEIYTAPSNGPLVVSLTIDRTNSEIVYVTTSDNQIIKSTDAGRTWKNIYTAQNPALKVVVDNFSGNSLYAVLQGGGVLRSRDGGQNWEEIANKIGEASGGNQDFGLAVQDPLRSGTVLVAGGAGLYRSRNFGDSWEKIKLLNDPMAFPVKSLAINPLNSNEIIYGAGQALYKSTDGGVNWATFQLASNKNTSVLKYATLDPKTIYLGLRK